KRGLFKDDIYNDFGSIYMIDVSIGTPPQTFRLAVDTGSADLWVPGSDCPPNSCPCTKFDESKSKTYQSSTDSFAIQYGIGSVNGSYATDTITIAGATVLGQKFGLASVTADIMEQPDMIDVSNNTSINGTSPVIMNGIFGLGYPRLTRAYSQSGNAYNPFVFNLVAQNLIENPVFSIFLNSISEADWSGEILFGGYDQNKFIGNLTYLDVAGLTAKITSEDSTTRMSNGYYYWMVYAQGIGVKNPLTTNGKPMTWGMSELGAFILDTGTTLTYFPELITTQIVTAFVGAGKFTLDPQYNVYIIDCAAATNSSFQFELILSKTAQVGNEQPIIVSVPAKELVISMEGNSVENSHNCMFGIAPLGKSSSLRSSNMYLIGDSVLRSLYMVYDMGKNRVGLAANKNMGGTV
ncbi:aspartic peptidase domain-containing protein, partial [Mycotypha africana]|uniref:aspartic peptidase domain-containing protein n=1 Tax=Mycotypha africana TaxID=64632 RepID=UPI002301DAE5